jgi:asparagine synthase (glutamine-hydrolysing)
VSALFGIFRRDLAPLPAESLARMAEAFRHRSPDSLRTWEEGPVGIGNGLLWTTPESCLEQLPYRDPESGLVLAADARIDNREELARSLAMGAPLDQIPDSLFILRAYQRWGEECPKHLLGDFAFVVWDPRQKQLFCARDHMGVRAFYYHCSDSLFVFGTELKAPLSLPEVSQEINEERLADYLLFHFEDKESTLYRSCRRLPPAHTLRVGVSEFRKSCYWNLDPNLETRFKTDAEYEEAFREIFVEAVRCRMRTNGSLGAMLSGGLDSSSIVGVARHLLAGAEKPELHTFSAIYDKVPECDEREYIHAMLEGGGVSPHFIHPDEIGPLTNWEELSNSTEEPLFNPQMMIHWLALKEAKRLSTRVMLDGLGGDAVICYGLGFLRELALAGKWFKLWNEIRNFCLFHKCNPISFAKNYIVLPLFPRLSLGIKKGRLYKHFGFSTRMIELFRKIEGPRFTFHSSNGKKLHLQEIQSGLNPITFEILDKTCAPPRTNSWVI